MKTACMFGKIMNIKTIKFLYCLGWVQKWKKKSREEKMQQLKDIKYILVELIFRRKMSDEFEENAREKQRLL